MLTIDNKINDNLHAASGFDANPEQADQQLAALFNEVSDAVILPPAGMDTDSGSISAEPVTNYGLSNHIGFHYQPVHYQGQGDYSRGIPAGLLQQITA